MKKLVVLALACMTIAVLSGCATTPTPKTKKPDFYLNFVPEKVLVEKDNYKALLNPVLFPSGFELLVENSGDTPIEINWNKSTFLINRVVTGNIRDSKVSINKRFDSQPNTVVPPMASYSGSIYSNEYVEYKGQYLGWGGKRLNIPGTYSVLLALVIDDKEVYQSLQYEVIKVPATQPANEPSK